MSNLKTSWRPSQSAAVVGALHIAPLRKIAEEHPRLKAVLRTRPHAAGLTLVELLVVLAILGLMAAVAIPSLARMGLFSSDDVGNGSRELFALLRAAKVHAATYRVDTAIAYGVVLKPDSVTGDPVETINAAAMVYRLPDAVRDRCLQSDNPEVDPVTGEIEKIPTDILANKNIDVFTPVKNELGGAIFKEFPRDTGIRAKFLLPNGEVDRETLGDLDRMEYDASFGLRRSVRPILVYEINIDESSGAYSVRLISPMRLDDADTGLLGSLPLYLQYLAALPEKLKYLSYKPDDKWMSLAFPAHIFTSSGRMEFAGLERVALLFGFSPDADPEERYLDPSDRLRGDGNRVAIELYRATGRVNLVTTPGEG